MSSNSPLGKYDIISAVDSLFVMLTLKPSYVQLVNFNVHFWSSNGKNSTLIPHLLFRIVGAYHLLRPSYRIITFVLNWSIWPLPNVSSALKGVTKHEWLNKIPTIFRRGCRRCESCDFTRSKIWDNFYFEWIYSKAASAIAGLVSSTFSRKSQRAYSYIILLTSFITRKTTRSIGRQCFMVLHTFRMNNSVLLLGITALKGVVPWIFQKILNAIFVFSVKNWSRKYILFRLKEVLFLEI